MKKIFKLDLTDVSETTVEIMKNTLQHEIEETKGTISNETCWLMGSSTDEEISGHMSNIEVQEEYQKVLQKAFDELDNPAEMLTSVTNGKAVRELYMDEDDETVLIGTETLGSVLISEDGKYANESARKMDEQIYYYVPDDVFNLSDESLRSWVTAFCN